MLKENEIRPSDLMKKARNAAMKDVSRLLSRIDEFEHTDCPACGLELQFIQIRKIRI